MAVAYASGNFATQTGDSALVITKPTGLAVGDMLVAFCMRDGAGNGFATPSNWTALTSAAQASNFSMACFGKVADSADVAASNFSFSPTSTAGDGTMGVLARITGSSFASPSSNTVSTSAADTPALSITGVTPLAPGSMLLMFWCNTDATSAATYSAHAVANSNPSWTHQFDEDGAGVYISFATASYSSGGATGNFSVSSDQGTNFIGALVSVIENLSVTVSPSVITTALTIPAPSVSGGATVSPSAVTLTASIPAPVVTTAAPDWVNPDKSATPSWDNPLKS